MARDHLVPIIPIVLARAFLVGDVEADFARVGEEFLVLLIEKILRPAAGVERRQADFFADGPRRLRQKVVPAALEFAQVAKGVLELL